MATELWKVGYDNDVGPNDDYYVEWATVENTETMVRFSCDDEEDAKWLCKVLNDHEKANGRGL